MVLWLFKKRSLSVGEIYWNIYRPATVESLIVQLVKNPPECRRPQFHLWVGKIPWRDRLPAPVFLGFPCGWVGKESTCNVGDLGSVPGLWRSPGEGKGYPFQYSGLENSMDCIVHGVAKNRTQLSEFHFHFQLWNGMVSGIWFQIPQGKMRNRRNIAECW